MLNEMKVSLETSDYIDVHLSNGECIRIDYVDAANTKSIHAHSVDGNMHIICDKHIVEFEVVLDGKVNELQ